MNDSSQQQPKSVAYTILVVDDEFALLVLAQEQIEDLGYRVYAASSGSEALQLLAEHEEIDLLFSDVIMSDDMNGYELALKAIELRPGLKLLLASGFTSQVMKQKGLALFDAEVLHKPYRYDELSDKLQEILNA
jgi:CheY-like chemotaxis protein